MTNSIKQCLDINDEVYLIVHTDDEWLWFHAEVQTADHWLGGEGLDGYVNDSGTHFSDSQQCQNYYSRNYKQVEVFEDEDKMQERVAQLED